MDFSLGIVLSGGGVRGVAHVGVLEALEEHGIRPDVIAGSSAGALVGALYGAGHSKEAMLEFFRKKSPFRWSKLSFGKPGFIDTAKVVADFREYFPEDSFESLRIPLFVTATDIVNARLVVFNSGPLIGPVLASCSVPVVFTPTEIDGRLFSDGGIIDNFPVEPLLGRCERVIGVYASPLKGVRQGDLKSSFAVSDRVLDVAMYFSSQRKFGDCDLVISPDALADFATFDTKHIREIFEIGYGAALEKIGAIEKALAVGP